MITIQTSRALLLNGFKKFKYSISPGIYNLAKAERDGIAWLVLEDKKRNHIGLPLSNWLRISNAIQPLSDEAKQIFNTTSPE